MSEEKIDRESVDGRAMMIKILKEHGIEMIVGGCGCCGSPWVTFKYNGEVIFDDEHADFDTMEELL